MTAPVPPPVPDERRRATLRVIGFSVGGVGLVLLVIGIVDLVVGATKPKSVLEVQDDGGSSLIGLAMLGVVLLVVATGLLNRAYVRRTHTAHALCPVCGARNEANDTFCEACGSPLS